MLNWSHVQACQTYSVMFCPVPMSSWCCLSRIDLLSLPRELLPGLRTWLDCLHQYGLSQCPLGLSFSLTLTSSPSLVMCPSSLVASQLTLHLLPQCLVWSRHSVNLWVDLSLDRVPKLEAINFYFIVSCNCLSEPCHKEVNTVLHML